MSCFDFLSTVFRLVLVCFTQVRRARETAEAVVKDFDRALLRVDIGGGASCRRLSAGVLTHVRLQRLPAAPGVSDEGALVYVEFTVKESSYARFFASATFGDGGLLKLESSGQLTSYQPFRECADPRLPLPFCVCKDV